MLNDDRGMVLTLIKARPEDRVERALRPAGFAGEVEFPSSFRFGFSSRPTSA